MHGPGEKFVFLLGMQSVPLSHFDGARQAGDQEDLWGVPDELMTWDRGGRDGKMIRRACGANQLLTVCVGMEGREFVTKRLCGSWQVVLYGAPHGLRCVGLLERALNS